MKQKNLVFPEPMRFWLAQVMEVSMSIADLGRLENSRTHAQSLEGSHIRFDYNIHVRLEFIGQLV